MQSGCGDIKKEAVFIFDHLTDLWPAVESDCGTRYQQLLSAASWLSRCPWERNGGSQREGKNIEEGFSAALCAPFIICMCEELQNCCYCFFFPSAFPPRNYEYGKKCQDVLESGGTGCWHQRSCRLLPGSSPRNDCVCVRALHMPGTRQVINVCVFPPLFKWEA